MNLRVLHLRNTKLNDSGAIRLLEQIIVHKAKIKYLNMSMNTSLGFQFQNHLIKMLRDVLAHNEKHHLKFLELKYCNLN
jgi:hypothetical protein